MEGDTTNAKISLRSVIITGTISCICGFIMGYCLFSTGQDRAERERIADLNARNKELEQRLSDNSERARQAIGAMAVNLERQLQLATDTAGLVRALREVLEDLQDYYDNIGDYNSTDDSGSSTNGGD